VAQESNNSPPENPGQTTPSGNPRGTSVSGLVGDAKTVLAAVAAAVEHQGLVQPGNQAVLFGTATISIGINTLVSPTQVAVVLEPA